MKKLLPWFLGIMIGIILSGLVGFILVVAGVVAASDKILDNGYSIIAVSWGAHRGQTSPQIYQARVSSNDKGGDGIHEVRAVVYIGSGLYQHDMGVIGTASSHEEAIRRFGQVTWTDSEMQIGGSEGIQARLDRAALERHR